MTESEDLLELQKQNSAVRAAEKKVVEAAERVHDLGKHGVANLATLNWAVRRLNAARRRQTKARNQLYKIRSGE